MRVSPLLFSATMKDNRKFKGIWIPAELWEAEQLSITEKCLLVEIDSLDNDPDRGCFASNDYLGKFLQLSAGRTANMISDLRKRGFISQVFFDGRNRGLRVPMLHENVLNLHENVKAAFTKTCEEPSRKREHSNKDIKTNRESENTHAPLPEYHSTAVHQRDVNAVKQNPNAWRAAVGTFKTLAGMRGIQYELTYLDAYFSNEQKHGRYYDLAAPANEADTHIWLSKHSAGLQLWAMRQGQFDRKPAPGQTPDQPAKAGFSLPK